MSTPTVFRERGFTSQQDARGFTLIELLVVIAIIGILSSVVLANLYLSRQKGADAAIKSDLHAIQLQIELDYANGNQTYAGAVGQSNPVSTIPAYNPAGSNLFVSDKTINSALKAAVAQGGLGMYAVGPNGTTYAVGINLKGDSTHWWCLDSTNGSKTESGTLTVSSGILIGGNSQPAVCP